MKFNLNKKKITKTQFKLLHYSHYYHSQITSKRHYSLLSLHCQRFLFACVCDSKSQFSWSFWFFSHEESSISCFLFFLFVFSFVAISFSASTFVFVTLTKFEISSWSNRWSFAFFSFISSTKRNQSRCIR